MVTRVTSYPERLVASPWLALLCAVLAGMATAGLHALVTVVFWLSLYLFERSWVKMLGLSVTLIVYLGGATFLVDRFLLWRRRVRTGSSRARRVIAPHVAGRRQD